MMQLMGVSVCYSLAQYKHLPKIMFQISLNEEFKGFYNSSKLNYINFKNGSSTRTSIV